jgi:hypothetical protein
MKRDERWDVEDGVLTISSPVIKCSRMLLPYRRIWGHIVGLTPGWLNDLQLDVQCFDNI